MYRIDLPEASISQMASWVIISMKELQNKSMFGLFTFEANIHNRTEMLEQDWTVPTVVASNLWSFIPLENAEHRPRPKAELGNTK